MKPKDKTYNTVVADINAVIDEVILRDGLTILEAGCGSLSRIKFPKDSYITGIDISIEQLDKNTILNEKLLGDLQTHKFEPDSFDLIVCWDVLEHLPHPDAALDNMIVALKPNGLIVIAVPNQDSLKGLITKFSPHWFHVFVYKNIFGKPNAGKPGHTPFPTFMKKAMSPRALADFFAHHGLEELKYELYDYLPQSLRVDKPKLTRLYYIAAESLSLISGARLGGRDNTDLACIYRKKAH